MSKQKNTAKHQTKSSPEKSKKGLPFIIAICISYITYIVFSPSLKCDFAGQWDDKEYVTENAMVVNNHIPVKEIFHTPVSLNYHPLTMLSLAYNYQTAKLNPEIYHSWNVWLHVFNTILVFMFIYFLTKQNLLMAAIVSIFFGIHPMHVESVTWISERKDVLYVFFCMAGLISYLKYIQHRKILWYLITLILFVLSCLSKAMAVVFPIVLLLIDYFVSASESKTFLQNKRIFIDKIPFLLISLGFGLAAFKIQQSGMIMQAMNLFSTPERIMFASYGAIMYIVKLIVPLNLSAFYAYPIYNHSTKFPLIIYLAPFILIAVSAFIYFFSRKDKAIVFGSLFYFFTVVLVLQFISVGNVIMADRYSYLSYVGLLFIVAHIVNLSFQKGNKLSSFKFIFIGIIIIGILVFSFQTYAQTKVWNNPETLWSNAINIDPDNCYTGYINRGIVYQKRGQNDLALSDFSKSIIINPSNSTAYLDRGAIYSDLRKDTAALMDFDLSIKLDPDNSEVYYDKGRVLAKLGKDSLAIINYDKALQLNPHYTLAYMNRGVVNYNRQQVDLALTDYNKAIETNPDLDIPYYNRGIIYYNKAQYNLALADFTKAIALNATVPQYWQYNSLTEKLLGKNIEAVADSIKAVQLTTGK